MEEMRLRSYSNRYHKAVHDDRLVDDAGTSLVEETVHVAVYSSYKEEHHQI